MCQQKYGYVNQRRFYQQVKPEYVVFDDFWRISWRNQNFLTRIKGNKWELLTDWWIKVGIVLGMMPGGMPGEKTEKF